MEQMAKILSEQQSFYRTTIEGVIYSDVFRNSPTLIIDALNRNPYIRFS